jgi:hypothetical protein
MSGLRAIFGFTLLTAGSLCLAVANPAPATQHHSAHKRAAKPEPVAAPAPVGPLVPLTLEQMPAMPPQVAYHNGELSFVAQNSTLVDILRAVHTQTGAAIDMPPNTTERVVGRFGPGPAREVMAALLNGSHFNYVMAGSAADPDGLQRLMLTPKLSSSEATSETVAQNQVNPPPNNPFMRTRRDENVPDSPGMAEDAADDNDSDVQTPDAPVQAGVQDQSDVNNQPPIKTPEQLLQELQRQQQAQPAVPQDTPVQPPRQR